MRKHLPSKEHFLGITLPFHPNYNIVSYLGSGANGHVYRAHTDHINADLACKFVPTENLPDDPTQQQLFLAEAKKANTLEHNCVVPYYDVQLWTDPHDRRTFAIFMSQYISGPPLDRFIKKHRADIDLGLIERFLATMLSLLFELSEREMVHGDLHAGNILVTQPRFDLSERVHFRVTDFGITEATGHSHRNDYLFIANILRDLLKCITYQELQARDRYAFNVLRNDFLARHLVETDPMADSFAVNPRRMQKKLSALDEMFTLAIREQTSTRMVSPFDYPNCEQMGNAHLLLKTLYSDRLLGLSQIKARI